MNEIKSSLGDHRLLRPMYKLLRSMGEKLSVVMRQLGASRSELVSFHRFVNNVKVTPDTLLKQYWQDKRKDWSDHDLLIVEDSSTISFKKQTNRRDLGWVGKGGHCEGFFIHNTLLLNAKDLNCMGVGAAKVSVLSTPPESIPGKKGRDARYAIVRHRPIEEKGTYKWIEGPLQTVKNCPNAKSYTVVADRECDVYEVLDRFYSKKWHFVVRGHKSHKTVQGDKKQLLTTTLEQLQETFGYKAKVSGNNIRTAHSANLLVKFATIELTKPTGHQNKSLPQRLRLQVIEVKESIQSVIPGEQPVHWIIFTSHPVQTIEQAQQVIQWYRGRWNIEQQYRTIKLEGLDVEHSEATTLHALSNIATLALIAATQVMILVLARGLVGTTIPVAEAFSPSEVQCIKQLNKTLEGKTDIQKNPFQSHTMAFAAWVIARLGGWTTYDYKRPPGPITMTNGLTQFYTIYKGFTLNST